MLNHALEEIFHPKSIAIVGASGKGIGFVAPFLEMGFEGKIYPVNPKYDEIMGLKAYPSITDIPEPVDYVISSIPSHAVLELIADSAVKGVKAIHLFTARFSETGRKDATELEKEILKQAKASGIRIIGPNCMGIYYPEGKITFNSDLPKESGKVGLISQSGQAVLEIVIEAAKRGIRFSKAISYGNALDFNESDFLEFLSRDPQTEIILMYVEGVRDGRRFQKILRQVAKIKPVIMLKGGRGEAGARATASHTASMAGSRQIWNALVRQAGVISVSDIEEMVDLATAFCFLPPIYSVNVGVTCSGGGNSVLAADLCEEAGLNVISLPEEIRKELKEKGSSIWDWIGNPADFSISMGDWSKATLVIEMMADSPKFDFIIVSLHGPLGDEKDEFNLEKHLEKFKLHKRNAKPFIVVLDERLRGSSKSEIDNYRLIMEQIKNYIISNRLPFYFTLGRAARSVSKMISYYKRKQIRLSVVDDLS